MRQSLSDIDGNEALEAVGTGEVQELSSGELYVRSAVNGYALAPQGGARFTVRRAKRDGSRSFVLAKGSFAECLSAITDLKAGELRAA